MPLVFNEGSKFKFIDVDFTVGDIVNVINPGAQYSHWDELNLFVLGRDTAYRIPYVYGENGVIMPKNSEVLKKWKVVNVIKAKNFYTGEMIVYHIRDKEGHDSFIGPKGLKLIRRPKHESIGIAKIKLFNYQIK